jgi:23S rRNA (guanine2445-N2)-methyltransferase / 23S rRNA (guanine2069-N7)-methyltransferase
MQAPSDKITLHVRTMTGLEGVLADELAALGARDLRPQNRLVICSGDLELLYRINLECRTAIRVLRPLISFAAPDEASFYRGMGKVDWSKWMSSTGTLAVNAHVHSSFTTHSLFISQFAKDAVVDQFRESTGERPSVDLKQPDLRIVVSLFQNTAQISVDASGESLHRRGYRLEAGEAPLNETLAAGILKLSGWDAASPLLDPMCGSGTFAIEAGLMATNRAPGLVGRSYGFQSWPDYDAPLFERLMAQAQAAVLPAPTACIVGLEIDPEVARVARHNVERAGLSGVVRIETGDFFEWNSSEQTVGTLVINPPYDERLRLHDVNAFWSQMGDRLASAYGGWTAHVLCGNPEAGKALGLRASRKITLFNGSIECRLSQFDLRATDTVAGAPIAAEENSAWVEKANVFANRLRKNLKHYSKWARREEVTCWRVYDKDIPEFPFVLDLYGDRLQFSEVQRNHEHTPAEHRRYMDFMVRTAASALELDAGSVNFKMRKLTKTGGAQQTLEAAGEFVSLNEGRHQFLVNLGGSADTGLPLELRTLRQRIEKEAASKAFLNLYGYAGSLTVCAVAGGAKSTTTVDSSSNYLEWTRKNLRLNGLSAVGQHFHRSDVLEFLERDGASYDLCVVDPPARSVNRSTSETFDAQEDHVRLLQLVLARMKPGGRVYFCTNYRGFALDEAALNASKTLRVKEVTGQITPLDFARAPSLRTFLIENSVANLSAATAH